MIGKTYAFYNVFSALNCFEKKIENRWDKWDKWDKPISHKGYSGSTFVPW